MKTWPCNIQRCYIENFIRKKNDFFIFAQNIDCGYTLELPHQGSSNKYPKSMFWIKNKKKVIYPCTPQVYYMKVGYNRVFISPTCVPYEHKKVLFTTVSKWLRSLYSVLLVIGGSSPVQITFGEAKLWLSVY